MPELSIETFTEKLYQPAVPVVVVIYDRCAPRHSTIRSHRAHSSPLSDQLGVKVEKWQKLMSGWRLQFVKLERKDPKTADPQNKDLVQRLQAEHANLPILFSYWKGVPLYALRGTDAVDEAKLEEWLKLINNYM